jgi:hypothetical protein
MPLSNVVEPIVENVVTGVAGGDVESVQADYNLFLDYRFKFYQVGNEFGDASLALVYTQQRYLVA